MIKVSITKTKEYQQETKQRQNQGLIVPCWLVAQKPKGIRN